MELHGVNTPVFSLRTYSSAGIGEFLDLIPLIDWAAERNFNAIQTLPLNDTGLDPSPYNIQSSLALNPLLIKWPDINSPELNKLDRIDYTAVRELKKNAYKTYPASEDEINQFIRDYPWVLDYAAHKDGDKSIIEQYVCHKQMTEVKAYAEKKGVFLVGDIPILIAPDSVDVQLYPELFIRDLSAGAPPDQYSEEGQNWGFPLYNWAEHEKSDYVWWKNRLKYAEEFYHYYRIDHIVGFYRIWACKIRTSGINGSFIPSDSDLWIPHGEKILKMMLKSTSMQPIGEDLGTIPDEVRLSLHNLGIPGTKVMRWEREWKEEGNYIPFDQYPKDSLTTVSTHDSTALRLWWMTQREEAMAWAALENWVPTPGITDRMIKSILKQSHHTSSSIHINLLLEYLSAIPTLRWHLPEQDRINIPGIVSEENWTWRMRPFLEEMIESSDLNQLIKEILP